MAQVPSNLIPTRITQLPVAPVASEDSLLIVVYNGNTYQIRAGDLLQVSGVPVTRQIIAGTALTGGGQLSSNVTLSVAPKAIDGALLADTGVSPGTYGNSTTIPVFTVDSTGRVTAVTTVAVDGGGGGVPVTREIIAGPGLTGGGTLASNVTLNANFSNAIPSSGHTTGDPGGSTQLSRADHQHPAVDLSSDDQVDNILGLGNGGTARSIVPDEGAIIWCGADGLYVGPVGAYGQVLVSGGAGEYVWGNVATDAPQPAHYVYIGPTSSPDAAPTFRLLVSDDLPVNIDNKTITDSTIDNTSIGATTPSTGVFTQVDVDNLRLDGNTLSSTNADGNINIDPTGTGVVSVPAPITDVDYMQLDTAAAAAIAVARLRWNVDTATMSFGIIDGTREVNIGQQMYALVNNAEATTITKGQVVYLYQATGNRASVKLAYNTGDATSAKTFGLVVEDIAAGQIGFVITQGVLDKLDTSAFLEGDSLYLGATPGSVTATKPAAPNHLVYVGTVERANAGNGQIYVRIQNGYELNEIHDVQIVSPINGNTLIYDASTNLWKNAGLTAGTGISVTNGPASITIGNTGVTSIAGTANQVTASASTGAVTLSLPATINVNTSGNAATATTSTNISGGAANRIAYQTAASTTSFISAPTISNTFLEWNGTAFQWSTNPLGTVTSVGLSAPTGFTVTNSPVTSSGTLTLSFSAGYSLPTTASQTNWDTAYTDRLKWDGGATGLVAATGRTSLGATTLGSNLFTITNPGAVTFPRFNADNSVSALDAATFRTAIGAGTGNGSVTSVGLSLPAEFSVTGSPVTSTGTLTGTWASQTQKYFFAAPNAANGTPVFRAIVASDIPTLNQNTTGSAGSVANSVTFNNGGAGGASGSTFNGSGALTVSYNTVGAPSTTGTNASGTWNISVTGNAATATTSTNIAGGAAGSIPYQTGAGATSLLAAGSGVLVGGSTPSYSTAPSLTGTNFTSIPNGALTNSSVTIGTTAVSLGGTSTTLAGLTSVTLTQDPTANLQAATKQYVDTIAATSITYHAPVKYEVPSTTGNLNATYNNGSSGVGATLTNAGTLTAFTPDGVVAQVGDRILIYNQTNAVQNGVYTVTTVGSGSVAWVLTRATDANSYGLKNPNALGEGDAFFVQSGNTGAGETYVCNTSGTITFGTTNITFTQVSATQIYSAGTGLTLTGTQFSLTTPVTAATGGTGQTSYTAGDLLYASGTTAISKLGIGVSNRILTSTGSAPQWTDPSTISVGTATTATNVSGTVAIANGGTGQTNKTAAFDALSPATTKGDLIVFDGTDNVRLPVGTNNFVLMADSAQTSGLKWAAAGTGTVTSVGLSLPAEFSVTGSPVTGAGTLTGAWATQTANTVLAGPTTGVAATPAFRALVNADVPATLTGKTYNGLTLTANATGFQIAGGTTSKTMVFTNSITLGGTDATTITLPSTSGTVALNNQQFFLGTTQIAINRGSASIALTGVSIDGSAGSATTATTATNVAGGAAGSLVYQTAASTTSTLALGTTNHVLTAGATAPQYVAQSTLAVGSATNSTNATNVGVTDDTTTAATVYPVWVTANTGNLPAKVTSTKLSFNPSTGVMAVTGGIGGGTF